MTPGSGEPRRSPHAALPTGLVLLQQHTLRLGTAPPRLAHGNHSNPTVPAATVPCQAQTTSNTQSAGSCKMYAGLQVGDKTPLSPPPPACARFRYLLAENLEGNERNRNSAFLSVCVQQPQKQERLAVLQAKSPSHSPAAGSGSAARLPLNGQLDNRAHEPWEWHQSRSRTERGQQSGDKIPKIKL